MLKFLQYGIFRIFAACLTPKIISHEKNQSLRVFQHWPRLLLRRPVYGALLRHVPYLLGIRLSGYVARRDFPPLEECKSAHLVSLVVTLNPRSHERYKRKKSLRRSGGHEQ